MSELVWEEDDYRSYAPITKETEFLIFTDKNGWYLNVVTNENYEEVHLCQGESKKALKSKAERIYQIIKE